METNYLGPWNVSFVETSYYVPILGGSTIGPLPEVLLYWSIQRTCRELKKLLDFHHILTRFAKN